MSQITLKKTIISLGAFKDSGGPTKTIAAFKRALSAELFCFCSPRELKKDRLAIEGAEGVVTSRLPLLEQIGYAQPHSADQAEHSFAASSIVSCHSFYRYHALWVNQMSRKHGVPYWFVPHGILDPWVMQNGRYVKRTYWKLGGKKFLDEAAAVIFSTRAERDKAASQFELPRAEVVPWPVELVDMSDSFKTRQIVRSQLGIPHEARVLIYFGRLHSMKCPLETIDSIAQADQPNLHLIMVGNPQDVSLVECNERAKKLGISSCVHVVGPVYGDAKYGYMHAADAYISLSYRENFNHTAAESLAAGLPVILSAGNDLLSEILEIGCAWGLEDNSVTSAASAIYDFMQKSDQSLLEMGERGRTWVESNLSFEPFQTRLLNLASLLI